MYVTNIVVLQTKATTLYILCNVMHVTCEIHVVVYRKCQDEHTMYIYMYVCIQLLLLCVYTHVRVHVYLYRVVEAFLQRDSECVNSKDGYSHTILHCAAFQDQLDIITLAMNQVIDSDAYLPWIWGTL